MKKINFSIVFFVLNAFCLSQPTYEYCRNGLNKPIPDLGTVRDTVTVPFNAYTITYISVKLDTILHTWISDLTVIITKANSNVTLTNNCGGSGDNFINTSFADTSQRYICSSPPPFSGFYKPVQLLFPFIGTLPGGQWILTITDNATGDTGYLRAWCLKFYAFESGIVKIDEQIPSDYSLSQNYPNPFNPATKIKFSLPLLSEGVGQNVKLVVYDVLGREVASLIPRGKEGLSPGTYEVDFDGTNLPSGVYYYQLTAGDPSLRSGQAFIVTKKMVLLR